MSPAAPALRRERLALAGLAAGAGATAGGLALRVAEQRWLNLSFEPSLQLSIALPVGLLLLLAMLRRPEVGLLVLILLAYSNGSEVLVRLGLPSVLQLLVPALLLVLTWAALRESSSGELRAPPRLLLLFGLAAVLFVAWTFLSTAWAAEPERGLRAGAELAKAATLGIVIAFVADRPARLRHAAWAMLGVGAVLAALSSWQVLASAWDQSFLGLARVKQAHIAGQVFKPRATGPLADPNFYAQMLLPLVPVGLALALGRKGPWLRLLAAAMAALVGLGVATSYSRGGALALGAALVLFALLERGRFRSGQVLAAAALLLCLLPLAPDGFWRRLGTLEILLPGEQEGLQSHDSSMDKRKLVMGAAALMALDHPLAGVGAGNYTTRFYAYADQIGAEGRVYNLVGAEAFAHCLYLELLAETGLVGFFLFALSVALALLSTTRAHAAFAAAGDTDSALLAHGLTAGLVGLLLSSVLLHGDYPRYPWMLLGLCAGAGGAAMRRRLEASR